MSRSVNTLTLLGRVGQAPEIRTVGQSKVATFSLATSEQWTDASGTKQERTAWHRCVAWNNGKGSGLADVVERYVTKGAQLYVSGAMEYRQWTDKDGNERTAAECKVREIVLLGGGQREAAAPAPAPRASGRPNSQPRVEADPFDDDDAALPF